MKEKVRYTNYILIWSVQTGRYIEKDVFRLVTSVGQITKNILSSHEESNLKPTDSAPRCSGILLNGIRRSEVRFLMGTQNFFFAPRS